LNHPLERLFVEEKFAVPGFRPNLSHQHRTSRLYGKMTHPYQRLLGATRNDVNATSMSLSLDLRRHTNNMKMTFSVNCARARSTHDFPVAQARLGDQHGTQQTLA
jgi:hypothetical protein